MSLINDYTIGIETKQRSAEAQEIAAMDRLATDLASQRQLSRYGRQRADQPHVHHGLMGRLLHAIGA